MKLLPFFLAGAALLATGAIARPPGRFDPRPPAPVPADCPLVISFASYGAGIDSGTLRAVEALLRRAVPPVSYSSHPWGREGEVRLCVQTSGRADSVRLFRAIRTRIPPRPRGPISLRTLEGLRFDAPRPH